MKPSDLPRLFTEAALLAGAPAPLTDGQSHYLRHVLRRESGAGLRLFNGRDGEWEGRLEFTGRREAIAVPERQIRAQPAPGLETHLLFSPLKKDAMDFLVQKAVELGVTHLHPVLTQNGEARRIREDRLGHQIVEAAEQCERLALPVLAPLAGLADRLEGWDPHLPIYACLERSGAPGLKPWGDERAAFLVGPEGGFTAEEAAWLQTLPFIRPVSLGPAILRAETAACLCLSSRVLAELNP